MTETGRLMNSGYLEKVCNSVTQSRKLGLKCFIGSRFYQTCTKKIFNEIKNGALQTQIICSMTDK